MIAAGWGVPTRILAPGPLVESQTVKILISTPASGRSQRDLKAWNVGVQRIHSIEEVRELLSVIPGSLSDDVSAEREDKLTQARKAFRRKLT